MRNHFNCTGTLSIILLIILIWIKLSVSYNDCAVEEFACTDDSCIPVGKRCDGVVHCPDGSDEVNCKGFVCELFKWHLCGDNQCVERSLTCNNEFDCIDLSDERNCSNRSITTSCPQNQFLCHNEGLCIPNLWVCNGIKECLNGEDETRCEKRPCFDGRRCGSGECVYSSWLCDGVSDCQDGSDEENCGNKTIPQLCTADRGLVLCADEKHCILQENVCDGFIDCPDKSDENSCFSDCNKNNCSESRNCINTTSTARNTTWCTCPPGHRLINGMECKDVDECSQYGTCDQVCTNTRGSYNCSCIDGYSLAIDNKSCEITHGSPTLHFADGVSLKGIFTKSDTTFVFMKDLVNAVGFTYDGGFMYFTEMVDDNMRINRASQNGSNLISFITMGLKKPELISVDPSTGNVYFTDGALKQIGVCSFDGKYCKTLITCGNDQPRGLTLHFTQGEMFWTEWGEKPRIARAYMDGSNQTDFITRDLIFPSGVAIDSHNSNQTLFWADSERKLIECVKLDGTDRRVIYKATLMHPYSITVFENRIYWSDLTARTIEGCDKRNGNNHKIYVKYLHDTIYTVEVYHWHLHDYLRTPCEDHPCAELCLRKHNNFSCACTEGRDVDVKPYLCTGSQIGSQRLLIGTINALWIMEYKMLGKPNIMQVPIIVENITAATFNIKDQSVFLADDITKSITKVNLMKNFTIDVILTDKSIDHIKSLDFDYLSNSIYWCDSNKRTIELYNLETKTRKIISTFTLGENPISISLVPENGILFYTVQKFKKFSEIILMNLDGSNKTKIVKDGLTGPVHLTYDALLERVFWADYGTGKIESYSVNNKSREQFKILQPFVTGITTLKSDVFWVKDYSNKLYWANKSHSLDNENVKQYTIDEINKIHQNFHHFISIAPRVPPYHPCQDNNGNCSHLCIPGAAMSAKCSCPLELKLHSDGRTCFQPDSCSFNEFFCERSNQCIPKKLRCNHIKDCSYGDDELGCKISIYCPDDYYFQCRNGDCINKTLVCDFNFDCRDKSDESNCEHINEICTIKEFMCQNKKCIPSSSLCNNVIDCPDGEDEIDCYSCPPEKFRCNLGKCIQKSWECDGEIDCRDGSDEHDKCAYKTCTHPNFLCNNGMCISSDLRCNNLDDCGDFSDEVKCRQIVKSHFCKENEFACNNDKSLCFPIQAHCNGSSECPNNEDEENCDTCPFGDFRCSDGKCIPFTFICDGEIDCINGFDENSTNCDHLLEKEPQKLILSNKYECKDGQLLDYNLVCDGTWNCKDGSDETEKCNIDCKNTTCKQLCKQRPTGPTCLCREGFQLSIDNKTCLQINECLLEPPVCAQKCFDTWGSFKCACFDGFELKIDGKSCKSKEEDPETIIFATSHTIFTLSHTWKLETELFSRLPFKISDFDISISNHYIYYSSEDERWIHRIDTNTKEHSIMNVTGLPQLISVDWITENVYYVNESISSRSISVCNFDLQLCYIIYSIRDHRRITALKVDAINKLIFFATVLMESPTKSKVYKCFLDGSYVEELHISDIDYITGIAFDYNKKLLYLTEKNFGRIFKITYDGTNQITILKNVSKATDLTIFEDRLFFLISSHVLQICPLYVRYNWCSNFTLHKGEISHFAINKSSIQPLIKNSCKDKKCKSLCVPSKGTVKCLCETNKLEKCIHNLVFSTSDLPFGGENSGLSFAWIFTVMVVLILIAGIAYGIYNIGSDRAREIFANHIQRSVRYFVQREGTEEDMVKMEVL